MIMNSQLVMMSKDLMQAIHDSQIYIATFFICMLLTATANWWWRLRQFPRMPFPPSVAEEDRISEPSSSSSSASKYQVFLSFRGPDTRQGFTDTLFEYLRDGGVRVFRDNNDLLVGHEIGEDLRKAIRDSQIYIPIFSKNYARSKWCLWELTEMVEVTRKSKDKEIIPIFYDVTTDDVKRENGLYDTAMKALGQDREVIQQCKDALIEVCKIKGWELKDKGHGEFCKSIVREISIMLRVKHKEVTDCLIGMDDQAKALMDLLNMESDGVKVVGIHGMGGIGKTTLAKVVFNQLSSSFDACSFISDVREKSDSRGLVHLQMQLLEDLGCRDLKIDDEDDGVNRIIALSRTKKVIIVLDDVSQTKQIEKLAGASNWFGARSRIIVTTRDKRNLEIKGQEIIPFEKELLDGEQTLKLFSLHTFGEKVPPDDYLALSKEVVSFTGLLPLAIETIGSLLHGHDKEFWRNKIEELKVIPLGDVQKKLKISYDSLDSREKEIFLDIACLFDGEKMTNPIYMWDACGFYPKSKVDVLVAMSLIKIKDGEFWMHDQVKDLGRGIVCAKSLENPEERSRIWEEKEALRILKDLKKGRGKIKVIRPEYCDWSDFTFTHEELGGLENLRFLELPERAQIAGNLQDCLPNLRWFYSWHCSVMKATNLSMKRLVILELICTDVSECWNGWNQLKGTDTLKVLDLTGSNCLRMTPDLSGCKSLERLTLSRCRNLIEIDPSIGNLKALKYLDCGDCDALRGLPDEICSLEELEQIIVDSNNDSFNLPESIGRLKSLKILRLDWLRLSELPHSIGDLKSLVDLNLDHTYITELPSTIGGLVNLKILNLQCCSRLASLPESVQNLKSLVKLSLVNTGIRELSSTIGGLVNFKILYLQGCSRLASLPESVQNLKSLVELDLDNTGITELPSTIGGLVNLKILNLRRCYRLASLPESVQNLKSLVELNLDNTGITELPSTIGGLVHLERLSLKYCFWLASLPESVQNLKSLVELNLDNTPITELPSTIGGLVNLKILNLQGCSRLASLPESVQNLKSLVKLSLVDTGITELPSTIGWLVNFERLNLWLPKSPNIPDYMVQVCAKFINYMVRARDDFGEEAEEADEV